MEAQNVTAEDTQTLRNEFRAAFAAFASDDEMAELGGVPLVSYVDLEVIAKASVVNLIAAITATISMTAMFDPLALHHRIVDGALTKWLRRIEELESTNSNS